MSLNRGWGEDIEWGYSQPIDARSQSVTAPRWSSDFAPTPKRERKMAIEKIGPGGL